MPAWLGVPAPCLQSSLEANGGFNDVLEADAHHATEILSGVCVLCSSRQERSVGECQCSGTTEGEGQADGALHHPTASGRILAAV